jgi:uncharacterized protein
MKLQPDKSDVQTITAHGPGWVASTTKKSRTAWCWARAASASPGREFRGELGPEHFAQLAALGEVVIFGSGQRIRFPQPAWLRALAQRIGRRNHGHRGGLPHLQHPGEEGRDVAAALLVEQPKRWQLEAISS